MARNYPRFLFAHSTETKSTGPFVLHALYPQLLGKVIILDGGGHQIEPVEVFVSADDAKIQQVYGAMYDWVTSYRMRQAKLSEDFYVRMSIIAQHLSAGEYRGDTVSISITYSPKMGARLDITRGGKKVSIDLINDDTINTVESRLWAEFIKRHGIAS